MTATKSELVDLSDYAWARLRNRVDGLTDEEYLWEPAPGCWTIRRRDDGRWRVDWSLPMPDPAPLTTIAWRLWHLIDMYGEDRAPRFLDVERQGPPIGFDDPHCEPPSRAAAAVDLLERAHARWDAHLAIAAEDRMRERLGPVAGQYADQTRAAYVLHMLDEFIHHGAEIGVLRDQWRWQQDAITGDPLVDRVIRGDAAVVDDLRGDASAREAVAHEHPDLVATAARYGRWELVEGLARLGLPLDRPGRTALHMAAGAGELDLVKTLVELGADPAATDPEYHATPLQWAEFLKRTAVAEWLASAGS